MPLMGSQCSVCGKIQFPRKRVCSGCLSIDQMCDYELSVIGELVSYTLNHYGSPALPGPYYFGFIRLPENIWLYSVLLADSEDDLEMGMAVQLAETKTWQDASGRERVTWRFRPLPGG